MISSTGSRYNETKKRRKKYNCIIVLGYEKGEEMKDYGGSSTERKFPSYGTAKKETQDEDNWYQWRINET